MGVGPAAPFAERGEAVASSTPAGPAATATHLGPCGALHATHQAIREWCAQHGHTLAGPSWEVYGHRQDVWNDDPAAIRTNVFYLLRAAPTFSPECD